MSTFMIYGAPCPPAAIADEKGNVVVFRDVIDMYWLETFARGVAVNMGAAAGLAVAPMRMDFVRKAAVPGTVTQALEIGRAVLDARAKRQNVIQKVCEATGARVFFTGKMSDVRREIVKGLRPLAGRSSPASTASPARPPRSPSRTKTWCCGSTARRVVMVPDLIMNLEIDTGEPITTEMLRYGQRVAVIGLAGARADENPKGARRRRAQSLRYPELTFTPLAARAA